MSSSAAVAADAAAVCFQGVEVSSLTHGLVCVQRILVLGAANCLMFADEESGEEVISPDSKQACETLASMAVDGAGPQAGEDNDCESESLHAGPHKRVRQEAIKRLECTRARMVKNYNKGSRVRTFHVGDAVGVAVDRSDRATLDRRFIPCLVIAVNGRDQCRLRCDAGVLHTLYYPSDLQPYPASYKSKFAFAAEDTVEDVPIIKLTAASRRQSYAQVSAVRCGCSKLDCGTNRCKCFKAGVKCTAKCHLGKKCKHNMHV